MDQSIWNPDENPTEIIYDPYINDGNFNTFLPPNGLSCGLILNASHPEFKVKPLGEMPVIPFNYSSNNEIIQLINPGLSGNYGAVKFLLDLITDTHIQIHFDHLISPNTRIIVTVERNGGEYQQGFIGVRNGPLNISIVTPLYYGDIIRLYNGNDENLYIHRGGFSMSFS